jgi:hypothetical protein
MKFEMERLAKAAPTTAHVVRHWFLALGGPGLILLGLIDSSVIPVPGSMDAMTIVLSAHQRTWWPYYAVMATVGSVIGAYVTYRLARNRGEKALHDRLSKRNAKKVVGVFERWGFGAIAGAASPADADGSVCDRGGGVAVFAEEIPGGDVVGAAGAVLHSGVSGSGVRAEDFCGGVGAWRGGVVRDDWGGSCGDGDIVDYAIQAEAGSAGGQR